MKNLFSVAIIMLLSIQCSMAQYYVYGLNDFRVKGGVHKITERYYVLKPGQDTSEAIRNDAGETVYLFDSNSRVLSMTATYNSKKLYQYLYEYENGDVSTVRFLFPDTPAAGVWHYSYSTDKVSSITYYDKTNNLKNRYKFVYYKDSVAQIEFTAGDTFRSRKVFVFDTKGNVVEKLGYVWYGNRFDKDVYEHDVFGNLIVAKHYLDNKPDDVDSYEYEYDSHHNYIRRVTYKNKKMIGVMIREIEYQ